VKYYVITEDYDVIEDCKGLSIPLATQRRFYIEEVAHLYAANLQSHAEHIRQRQAVSVVGSILGKQ
jgi:hypothetical protein